MPYANRVIHLDFPDISADDDPIWIKLRNPRFLAPEEVDERTVARAARKAPADAGIEVDADDEGTSYAIFSKLIIGWHVYDATDDSDDPPPMPIPATVANVKKLPLEILQKLGEELAKANPQKATENQEDGTSRTS